MNPLPNAPQNFSVVAVSSSQISLSWTASTNATGYIVSRNGAAVATVTGTGWLDSGLAANTTYSYSVTATCSWGNSAPSATNSATTFSSGSAYWWDAGGLTAGAQDGNDRWGGGATNWWNGSAIVSWADGNLAIFGNGTTTNCTVTITNNITPGGILFSANNGGTYNLSSGGGSSLILSGTPIIICNDNATINAVLQGGGVLNLGGSGALTLTAANTYTGGTVIGGGVLTVSGSGQLGGGSYAGIMADSGVFNYGSTLAQTVSGVISGSGTVSATGSGTLTLSGANTYSGGTAVAPNGDITGLTVANTSGLGTGALLVKGGNQYAASVSVSGGLAITNAVTLRRGNSGSGRATIGLGASSIWSGPITVDGTSGTGFGGILLGGTSAATASIVSGNIGYSTLGTGNSSNPNFVLRNSGGYGKVTGAISLSTGYMQINDTPKVEYDNTNNVWGTFDINNASAIAYVGATNTLSASGVVYSSAGGTLQMNNLAGTAAYSQIIAGLSGNVKVSLSTGAATLTLNTTGNQFQTNVISGAVSLVKSGSGTQTLAGTNTYTGTTTISNGTLALGATGSISTCPSIIIVSNATFDVSAPAAFAFTGSASVQTLAGGSPMGRPTSRRRARR